MRDLLTDFEESYLPQLSEGGQSAYKDSLGLFRQYFVDQRGNPLVAQVPPSDVARFIDWRRALRSGALSLSRLMQGLLFGVQPHDPLTLVAAVMALVGVLACWIPALRAARIDPAVALRS